MSTNVLYYLSLQGGNKLLVDCTHGSRNSRRICSAVTFIRARFASTLSRPRIRMRLWLSSAGTRTLKDGGEELSRYAYLAA